MQQKRKLGKNTEYKDGFSPVSEEELLAVLASVKEQRAGAKDMLRVFAATLEKKALHANSKVDLYRVVNAKASEKGVKRLSQTNINEALSRVEQVKKAHSGKNTRSRAISRIALRQIAQGVFSTSEAVSFLFYSARRIRQGRAELRKLKAKERYGRFRYKELQAASGLTPAKATEAIRRLREKGFLHTVEVKKQNENAYGQLFVDGWLISLFRRMAETVKKIIKRERPHPQNGNTPLHKKATLINKNLKRERKKDLEVSFEKRETLSETLERLRKRFSLEMEVKTPQVA